MERMEKLPGRMLSVCDSAGRTEDTGGIVGGVVVTEPAKMAVQCIGSGWREVTSVCAVRLSVNVWKRSPRVGLSHGAVSRLIATGGAAKCKEKGRVRERVERVRITAGRRGEECVCGGGCRETPRAGERERDGRVARGQCALE